MQEGKNERGEPSLHPRVLDRLAVGVLVHDATLHIVYANGAAAKLLGLTPSEALKRDVSDPRWVVTHPDGSPVLFDEIPASVALRTKRAVHGMILGVRRPDGGVTWLAVDAVPLVSVSGEVELVAVTLADVTRELVARMQLEAASDTMGQTIRERDAALAQAVRALDTSEARYQAVLRAMSEGVAVHGPEGTILFANPAALQILGLSLEQLQGRHPVDPAWHMTDAMGKPLAPAQVPSEITRRTGEPQRHTVLGVQRPDGLAWLSVSTDPITGAVDGKTHGVSVVATFTDITSERRALADAQAARDQLHDIAAALPGMLMEHVVSPEGRVVFRYVSAPVREYFELTPEAVLADSNLLWARIHPEDRVTLLNTLKHPGERAGLHVEFRTLPANAESRHLRLRSGAPVRIAEGTLFRSVILDVTEQRRLEETVREAQRREALGTLAAGVAHNLNNMLAVIGPNLESIKARVPSTLTPEVEDALTATRAATELVRQLIQLVRRDAPNTTAKVDVGKLALEVSQLCRRTFDSGIEISCSVPEVPCLVLGRRGELQQALVNLCINARDAMAGIDKPRLTLKLRADAKQLMLEVEDNGTGMPLQIQRRLGEPFFTTKEPGRGTGLGLATVYGIVADLHGTLKFDSTLGKGTVFRIHLPRYHAPSASVPAMPRVEVPVPRTKVLVIDDEELVRNTLKRALGRSNADVLCAGGAEEGIEMLSRTPDVGLVILDMAMPDLNGAEVLRRIRAFNPSVPVYLMTGFLPDGIDVSLANGVLLKPVELAQLRDLLVQHAGAAPPNPS